MEQREATDYGRVVCTARPCELSAHGISRPWGFKNSIDDIVDASRTKSTRQMHVTVQS